MYHKFCWEKETLKSLQKKAKKNQIYSGVCAADWEDGDDLYTAFMQQVMDDGEDGWIYILDGDITGSVCDGVVIYPTQIYKEYHVRRVAGKPSQLEILN